MTLRVDISTKIKPVGFHVIPKRWVVERTFSWFFNSRRLVKDFEKTVELQEAMIKISHFHTLLKLLWIHFLNYDDEGNIKGYFPLKENKLGKDWVAKDVADKIFVVMIMEEI